MAWRNGGGNDDASSFFVFEATGDSEADFDPQSDSDPRSNPASETGRGIEAASDNDDAESCSTDPSTCTLATQDDEDFRETDIGGDGGGDGDGGDCYGDYRNVEFSCDDGLEIVVVGEEAEVESRRGVGVDGRREMVMDEMENKVFWETCLDVGYP